MALVEAPNRTPFSDSSWDYRRKGLIIASVMSGVMLQLLILGNMSYLYGTSFDQSSRSKAINILAVDFDGGDIGTAVIQATGNFDTEYYPRISVVASKYSDAQAVRQAVCKADYWAAIYINEGASERLQNTLDGNSSDTYDPTSAISYVYNQARYPVVGDSVIITTLEAIVGASRGAYYQSNNGTLDSLNTSNPAAVAAYLNPISATSDLIAPTTQVSRVFYNTVNTVIPPLVQFFFILALNGIGLQTGFLATVNIKQVMTFRVVVGKIYTLVAGLAMAGFIWAFREDWAVDGAAFAKTWMLLWLLMDVHWQVMETLIASYIPMQYSPFFVFTWIITNVGSTVFPFELEPGWYKVGYALPSYGAYSILIQIWSGCASRLYVALPVLLAWWVIAHITALFSIRKRCLDAAQSMPGYNLEGSTAGTESDQVGETDKAVDL